MLCSHNVVFIFGLPVCIQTKMDFKLPAKHDGKTKVIISIMCILADYHLCRSYEELNNHVTPAILDDNEESLFFHPRWPPARVCGSKDGCCCYGNHKQQQKNALQYLSHQNKLYFSNYFIC